MTFRGMTKAFLFLLMLHVSPVNASEIVISGADAQWGASLKVSEQLINVGSVVKPRIIVQYSNSIYASGLSVIPASFNDLANVLAPSKRLVINQAGSSYKVALAFPEEIRGGVYVEDDKRGSVIPEVFALFQNYPNPFNPRTEISFHLPKNSYITLTVYNALGQKVATLIDEKRGAGSYRVVWVATGFPSGIYFYRLSAKGFVETHKMLLMR